MNIISCHGFAKSSILTVILTCHNDLVPHYLSKIFFIVETEVGGVDYITMNVKEKINSDNLHQEDSLITRKADIPSVVNKLKNYHCKRCV